MSEQLPNRIEKTIVENITKTLNRLGIMYRIFNRAKDSRSLEKKILSKPKYLAGEAKIQDLIGIRIVLYFPDDIALVHNAMSINYTERQKDASIDDHDDNTFKPVRYNLIYELPSNSRYALNCENAQCIDDTFELQIRTVLSEGWHEVEHDLRYKFEEDWKESPTESRKLNGVYAALETNEWTMLQILDEVAYKHYKQQNWEAMLRQKLRLRIQDFKLGDEISQLFDADTELAKKFFRVDRQELLSEMYKKGFSYPLNLKNLVWFANIVFIQDAAILKMTPELFVEEFS
ncbi:RelA/SpoT domain-containing protein [Vibrio europaeus]|uniref:RelA/SpoT domain-containing protein n=1 Tax=Vibrio europaeus TaxID=300876 RepID=UPI00233E8BE8|nr:RelA/SpoT domain-containing protein [Vibrio europaeus]MDC5720152.1 RelA/SpoT domain-containing protein [Vibrio europaeus]MDC5756888.1 RelA/SpoT domain-containing protein [Vibrio europaeus]MDC5775428.1 RelA/SpoT domain-containing protein [Vibrio europaeus]MDC5794566.1 RelA/SpoT domain-containing protein [Vibrio europaeus]MDC5800837.1 RelA/SpoT domain-containing protein [Vibrio europaeus]